MKKLYFKQWIIGLAHGDIKEVIRTRTFNQDIKWLQPGNNERFHADPFFLRAENGSIEILYEDFSFEEYYGNISLMRLDRNMNHVDRKILLDTRSHLSYPFIFREKQNIYVFPESAHNGNLVCYQYDPVDVSLRYIKEIIGMPLYDATILKRYGKYWLFGTINENRTGYKLHIFHSDNLLGPYIPHSKNPVRTGLNGTRSAGNFIEVDGVIYRPAQNCEKEYGESVTINRLLVLDEDNFEEVPYMTIKIDGKNMKNSRIHTIHTINAIDDLIVVDGMQWTFSIREQWRNFLRNRRIIRRLRSEKDNSQKTLTAL